MMNRHRSLVAALAIALVAGGCSDDSTSSSDGRPPTDGGVDSYIGSDLAPLPDGYGPLLPCAEPGTLCDADDPCAIRAVCGQDRRCHPSGFQSCDDGLECTEDICKGHGLCENAPRPGFCAVLTDEGGKLSFSCVTKDTKDPDDACQVCDPDNDFYGWSPANGGGCDDGDPCTKNDYCQTGICKGSYYGDQCADNLACTEDQCDGTGACLPPKLMPDSCLINGACYKEGDVGVTATGCGVCDVSASQSTWTPLSSYCMINNTCYKAGDKDSTGCSYCDPTQPFQWTPLLGLCKIGPACYAKGDKHPGGCAECDPDVSATSWTVTTNQCLINDACYPAGTKDPTNCSQCDPTASKTSWTPLAGMCQISGGMPPLPPPGACYAKGDKHPGGCAECDPDVSATSWTVTTNQCLINDTCYPAGAKGPSGCDQCDPSTSKTAWTPLANQCLIGGQCYPDQSKDTTGCLLCDVSKSATSWTPVTGVSSTTHGFEGGSATGWTLDPPTNNVGWTVSSKRASGGTYALYYGNPTAGNYDTSNQSNSGTASMPAIALTAGKKAGMTFMLYADVEQPASYDKLEVWIGSTKLWEKSPTTVPQMAAWQQIVIDLSAHAGQTVTIIFKFDTMDSVQNTTEGIYIDEVTVFHNC